MIGLDERRALLRAATKAEHREVMDLLRRAFDGADEAERTALARTLPPGRWAKQEGPTPRAVLVLAALGSPGALAEALLPVGSREDRRTVGRAGEALRAVVREGTSGRSAEWATRWVDEAAERMYWNPWLVGHLITDAIEVHDLHPDSVVYLRHAVQTALSPEGPSERFWEHDLWQLFRVEGMGGEWFLVSHEQERWEALLRGRAEADPAFRARLLAESLDGLLRDFRAAAVVWYHRVHRSLDPTPAEVRGLEARYLAVLRTAPSASVGLAQEMLARALPTGAGDVAGLLDASRIVLGRTEKKVLTAQVRLLGDLVKVAPEHAAAVGEVLAEAVATLPPEIAARARRLVPEPAITPADPGPAPVEGGAPVVVPSWRRTDLPAVALDRPPLDSAEDAIALVVEHLEGVGDGADLPRLAVWLRDVARPQDAPAPLLDRARAVVDDEWDPEDVSPRRHLAALVLARSGATVTGPHHRGYERYVWPDSGWDRRLVPTHAPTALLAEHLQQARFAIAEGRAGAPATVRPLAAAATTWTREPGIPGGGRYGAERGDAWPEAGTPWPFWSRDDPAPVDALLDVSGVREHAWFRVWSARDQDGFDQVVQWAAWVLGENLDTLAAHAHPMLVASTVVGNVRGMAPLLSALGAARRVPGDPTWSALALASSARAAENRALAAEAVAALAGSGLLDPVPFAGQVRLLLAEGFVKAGRLAGTWADAASISAIAGFRVLQVVEALLPDVVGVTGGGTVVALAARLSAEYGTPVVVPEVLAAKGKGGSATAVAVRALLAVRPAATDLVVEAAAQAAEVPA